MNELTLYFVRHGQTDYNKSGIVQGSGIDSSLNETGYAQAQAFFEHYRHLKFDRIFASTLKRTHQTLSFWKEAGYTFTTDPGLNEFSWGIHEGKKPSPEQNRNFRAILTKWAEGDFSEKVPQGESPVDAWERSKPFFDRLLNDYMGEQILLCSHGRQLRVILSNLLHADMRQMEQFSHHNTALSILKILPDGEAQLQLLNDTTHLEASRLNIDS